MELEQDSNLTLPLFHFDEQLASRDLEHPDLLLRVKLTEDLLAQLCQNPAADSSLAITLTDYQLQLLSNDYASLTDAEHSAQLTLIRGPVLSATLNCEHDHSFVSPQLDMMPTFDLGDEQEGE